MQKYTTNQALRSKSPLKAIKSPKWGLHSPWVLLSQNGIFFLSTDHQCHFQTPAAYDIGRVWQQIQKNLFLASRPKIYLVWLVWWVWPGQSASSFFAWHHDLEMTKQSGYLRKGHSLWSDGSLSTAELVLDTLTHSHRSILVLCLRNLKNFLNLKMSLIFVFLCQI